MTKIEGVPDGYELVRIGRLLPTDIDKHSFITEVNILKVESDELWREGIYAIVRKIEPKVRPMTRSEFLAAWKQRWFCPLIDHEDDIDIVLGVIDEPTEFDPDIVNTDKHGWLSLDVLSGFKFASDETYLTVEE